MSFFILFFLQGKKHPEPPFVCLQADPPKGAPLSRMRSPELTLVRGEETPHPGKLGRKLPYLSPIFLRARLSFLKIIGSPTPIVAYLPFPYYDSESQATSLRAPLSLGIPHVDASEVDVLINRVLLLFICLLLRGPQKRPGKGRGKIIFPALNNPLCNCR